MSDEKKSESAPIRRPFALRFPQGELEIRDLAQLGFVILGFAFLAAIFFPWVSGEIFASKGMEYGLFFALVVTLGVGVFLVFKAGGWFWLGVKLAFDKKARIFAFAGKNNSVSVEAHKQLDTMPWSKKSPEKNVKIDEQNMHLDAHSNRPFFFIIEDIRRNVNLLRSYKPDDANQNINRENQQQFWTGYQMGRRHAKDMMNLLIILLIIAAVAALAGIAGAYYGYNHDTVLQGISGTVSNINQIVTDLNKSAFQPVVQQVAAGVPAGAQVVK